MDRPQRRALVLAALYWAVGTLWIVGSDFLVERLARGPVELPSAQTWKGLVFVGTTAALFFIVLYRELRRSSEARRSVELQGRILDEISDAVIATNLRGGVMLWNRAAEELFGWVADEVGAGELAALLPPRIRVTREGAVEAGADSGARFRGEFLATKRDGSTVPVYAVSSPIQEPDGRVRGVLVVATDISAEKAAERALEEGEARYRALIEGSSDVTTLLDRDGALRYVSPAYSRILGWGEESPLSAQTLAEFPIHPDDWPAVERAFREVTATPDRSVTVEARLQHADGSWVSMEHRARNRLDDDALRGVVVHSRDLSTHRRLEQQLRQAQKMEAVGRLAGGVAHDFNNIVTGIMGHAQLLLAEMEVGTTGHADVQEIHHAAQRAGALTRQLLAFSRQQILRPEILDLNAVVGSLRGMLQRLVEATIEVRADLSEDLNRVRIDGGQLEQVIMNLVVNARDAMPDRGTVTLRTGNVTLRPQDTHRFPFQMPPGDYVTLAVEDTGSGIPREIRDRIFEPFFTTKEVGKGTGLGLSTVYGIVKQSGGFIWVDSEPGRGSTFTVYLPRAEGEVSQRAEPEPSVQPRVGDEVVLVVEDDAAIRRILVRTLERWGHRVHEAADGLQGLDALRREPAVELVISDLVMPGMGGREMAEQAVREGWKGKFLFISGYASDPEMRDSLLTGAAELLPKPFTSGELARRMQRLLDGSPDG